MGLALGPMMGGVVAEWMGYRNTFYLTGAILLANGLMILLVVKEGEESREVGTSMRVGEFFSGVWRVASSKAVLPALALLLLVQGSTVAFNPVVPGFILELSPGASAGSLTGLGFGLLNMASAVSALAVVQVVDRWGVRRIMVWSGAASCLIFMSAVLLESSWQLVALMGAVGVTSGAMLSGANTVASASVSSGQYGRVFGAVQSASSMAWGLGPLMGGGLAAGVSNEAAFVASAGLVLGAVVLAGRADRLDSALNK